MLIRSPTSVPEMTFFVKTAMVALYKQIDHQLDELYGSENYVDERKSSNLDVSRPARLTAYKKKPIRTCRMHQRYVSLSDAVCL